MRPRPRRNKICCTNRVKSSDMKAPIQPKEGPQKLSKTAKPIKNKRPTQPLSYIENKTRGLQLHHCKT